MSYGDFVILRMVPFYADSVEFQLKGTTSCQECSSLKSDCVEAVSFSDMLSGSQTDLR